MRRLGIGDFGDMSDPGLIQTAKKRLQKPAARFFPDWRMSVCMHS
jgi:hypothetical protein